MTPELAVIPAAATDTCHAGWRIRQSSRQAEAKPEAV
jgi:hypothetical protein